MVHLAPALLLGLNWGELLLPHLSWLEKIIRPLIVYIVLLVLFRFGSKRELAQATLFDFLIVLLISNVVQNAMIGEDNSVLGAVAGAITLMVFSGAFNRITARSKKVRAVLEGEPVLLVSHGQINEPAMSRQTIARNDLLSQIRKQGISRLADVRFAILELDGGISVIKIDDTDGPHDCLPPELVGAASAEGSSG